MTKIKRASLASSWRSWVDNDPAHRVGPWWLAWLWTLRFCAGLAVPFTGFGIFAAASSRDAWPSWQEGVGLYGKYFVVTLAIGVVIHLLFDGGRRLYATPRRVRAWKPWQRTLYFSGLPLFGVALGWPLGMALVGADVVGGIVVRGGGRTVVGVLLTSLLIAFLFHHYFSARAQQLQAEKRAAEAQLRLLQAQIEPHFLFNTLANVISLIDHDAPRAKQMLESFTDYLRSSLSSLRHDQATLGSELDLARTYLCLLKTRMEDRLECCTSTPTTSTPACRRRTPSSSSARRSPSSRGSWTRRSSGKCTARPSSICSIWKARGATRRAGSTRASATTRASCR